MKNIIKYQLMGRRSSLLLFSVIIFGLNAIALLLEAAKFTFWDTPTSAGLVGFWMPVSIIATVVTVAIMFFRCGSGHIDELLYRDTSYLMLTIPRRGWQILGGRLVAGMIEFLAYALSGGIFLALHAGAGAALASNNALSFGKFLGFLFGQTLGANTGNTLLVLLLGFCVYVTVGVFVTFATVASRTFIRSKGIATAAAVTVFIVFTNWTVNLGTKLGNLLNWNAKLLFTFSQTMEGSGSNWRLYEGYPVNKELVIPVAPFLLFLVLAAILFVAASELLEKKVEL